MDALTTTEDVTHMTDEELAERGRSIESERARRAVLTDAERTTDDMALSYLQAQSREQGAAFEPPTGFIGSYPRGWRITYDGRTFEAAAPGVVTPPPDEGCWTEVDPDTPIIPFWDPGSYDKGQLVRDAGRVWRALADDTDGPRPSEYPGGWSPLD